jgi:HEAT repeat protein
MRRIRQAVPALISLLNQPTSAEQRSVLVWSLGQIGDPASANALIEVARFDADADVRGVALIALASIRGAAALDTISSTDRIAWTDRLIDRAAEARRVALGQSVPARFRGASVLQVAGASAGSIWLSTLPDGSPRFAVATSDGEIVLNAMPSDATNLHRIDLAPAPVR